MESKIDLENFCVDITDPVNAELLGEFMKDMAHVKATGYRYYGKDEGVKFGGKRNWRKIPICTLPELQKQHPGVFDLWQPKDNEMIRCKKTCFDVTGRILHKEGKLYEWLSGSVLSEMDSLHTMGAKFLNEYFEPASSSTPSFKAGQEVPKYGDKVNVKTPVEEFLEATYICPNPEIEGNHFLRKAKSTEYMSAHIDVIRPIPAQPTMESELRQMLIDYGIFTLEAHILVPNILAWHQKHSGRVEVSDEEIKNKWAKIAAYGYSGSLPEYAVTIVRHFMTRKEKQG